MRERVRLVIESRRFQQAIIGVILINAATLGIETSPSAVARYGDLLHIVDHCALYVFVVELLAKAYVYRLRFLLDPWNVFDTLIIAISFLPTASGLSVLRALRVLRTLRLISVVPSLRRVVSALLNAVPGMASIVLLLGLVLYVAAVMGTKLYGTASPEYFGDLSKSLFSLFQVMTGDAWSDIARPLMDTHSSAWLYFVVFVLICTFVVLNLFIAVVVSAMEEESREESRKERHDEQDVLSEVAALRQEIQSLREILVERVPS
ncbi:ion transporter [Microtetraspora malaysiensis]|uniref:ion transporter n=1 Tax=Microtetraspora malaysiensis TaxID=161358 RepID=UPI003D93A857